LVPSAQLSLKLLTISVPGLERAARFFAFFVGEAARASRESIDPKP
jgi:hypothetical protein